MTDPTPDVEPPEDDIDRIARMLQEDQDGEPPAGVPTHISIQDAQKLRDRHPGAGLLMLPDPVELAQYNTSPELMSALLRTMLESVEQVFQAGLDLDIERGDRDLPNVRHAAVTIENALVDVYQHDVRIIARAFTIHFMDDAVHVLQTAAEQSATTDEETQA